MHSFVPAVFLAVFAAANAGVIIGPSVPRYPAAVYNTYKTVYAQPIATRSVYSSPVKNVQTDESFINGARGTIQTKKVSSQSGIATYAGAIHTPILSYSAPVITSHHYVAPAVVTKGVKYVHSPIGYVPQGSGLEGQYVDDQSERFYDDGSYRPEHH